MSQLLTSGWITRREFVARAVVVGVGASLAGSLEAAPAAQVAGKRLKVAALVTAFHHRSHAHVILENFLEPYLFNGQVIRPNVEVVGLYVDQFPADDMARAVGRQYKIPIYPSIEGALCRGGRELAVDAVLSICEHGKYPINKKAQREYPRKKFFDQIVAVFERSRRVVPVFNDKHLSYRWDWAKEMVDTARRLEIPLMAGSSVPLAERRPPLELPSGAALSAAVCIHGGPIEQYDFHGLELLESMVECRRGGETGVSRVQFLEGPSLWKAADEGRWSPDVATAAMTAELGKEHDLTRAIALGGKTPSGSPVPMHGILVGYRDGLSAIVLRVDTSVTRWNFACRVKGSDEVLATSLYVGPWNDRNLFKALSHAIQTHFRDRRAPYPVERTLLTTGTLDAAMDSYVAGGREVKTPQLEFAYAPVDFSAMRERGATWKIITDQLPEPMGISRVLPKR